MKVGFYFLLGLLLIMPVSLQTGKRTYDETLTLEDQITSTIEDFEDNPIDSLFLEESLYEGQGDGSEDRVNQACNKFFTLLQKCKEHLDQASTYEEREKSILNLKDLYDALSELALKYEGFEHLVDQIHNFLRKNYPELLNLVCEEE